MLRCARQATRSPGGARGGAARHCRGAARLRRRYTRHLDRCGGTCCARRFRAPGDHRADRAARVGCCARPAPAHTLVAACAVSRPLTRRARSLAQCTTSPTRQTRTPTRRSRRSTGSHATPLAWAASSTALWRSEAKARRLPSALWSISWGFCMLPSCALRLTSPGCTVAVARDLAALTRSRAVPRTRRVVVWLLPVWHWRTRHARSCAARRRRC